MGGNWSTRRKPTTFSRALTDSFHMNPESVARIKPTISEVEGACSDEPPTCCLTRNVNFWIFQGENEHHWQEGNLPSGSKCFLCKKSCSTSECLASVKCKWCATTVSKHTQNFQFQPSHAVFVVNVEQKWHIDYYYIIPGSFRMLWSDNEAMWLWWLQPPHATTLCSISSQPCSLEENVQWSSKKL